MRSARRLTRRSRQRTLCLRMRLREMRSQSDSIDRQIEGYRSLVASLEQVKPSLPADDQPLIDTLITRLNASIELQEQLRDALRSGADGVEAGNADAQAKHAEIKQLADQASQSLGDAKVEYDQNIKPSLDELASTVTDAGSSLLVDDGSAHLGGRRSVRHGELYVKRARQRQAEARRGVERVVTDFREPRAAEPTYERGVGGGGYRRSSRDHRI